MRKFFLVLLLGLLSACKPLVTSTPPPAPQPIRVAYSATLLPWVEILHQCARENPEIGLITQETSAADLEFSTADLTLWFGEPPQGIPGYAARLGTDKIVIIAGADVAQRDLSSDQLQGLYTESESAYQVWSYPEGNELRNIFDHTVLGAITLSPAARLAPNPSAMMEAVAADPLAIGYVPKSWVSEAVQIISIERGLQAAFEHPILSLPNTEPTGNLRTYLVCLQNTAP